jgi:hypothetical protein
MSAESRAQASDDEQTWPKLELHHKARNEDNMPLRLALNAGYGLSVRYSVVKAQLSSLIRPTDTHRFGTWVLS